jgi:Tol biopolymer transport system component
MRSDGTDRKLLVSPADQETVGTYSWSPDSSQIAYALERDIGFGRGVWVIDADGSSPARQIAPASTQPPMTDEYGNQIGSGGHWIEGWSSDGSAILVRGPFGEPTEGLQSVPLSGDTPTLLVPGAYMGSWQWASGQ